mgnify:CR=1 FL=1
MLMILGPQCAAVAHPLGEALKNWNITFVSQFPLCDKDSIIESIDYALCELD